VREYTVGVLGLAGLEHQAERNTLVPVAPCESNQTANVSITLNKGDRTTHVGTYPLSGVDALAKAAVINAVVQRVLAEWPNIAYSDQVATIVRELCSQKK
jgi:hypothetical protein